MLYQFDGIMYLWNAFRERILEGGSLVSRQQAGEHKKSNNPT